MSRPENSEDIREITPGYWMYLRDKIEQMVGTPIEEDIAKGLFREIIKSVPEYLSSVKKETLSVWGVGRFKVVSESDNYLMRLTVSETMSKYIKELYTEHGEVFNKEDIKSSLLGKDLQRVIKEGYEQGYLKRLESLRRDVCLAIEKERERGLKGSVRRVKTDRIYSKGSEMYKNEFEADDLDITSLEGEESKEEIGKGKFIEGERDIQDGSDEGVLDVLESASFEGQVFPKDIKPTIDFYFDD